MGRKKENWSPEDWGQYYEQIQKHWVGFGLDWAREFARLAASNIKIILWAVALSLMMQYGMKNLSAGTQAHAVHGLALGLQSQSQQVAAARAGERTELFGLNQRNRQRQDKRRE